MQFNCGRFQLSLDRPLIMGIVNMTTDSFSGDGQGGAGFVAALKHAQDQLAAGADILDIGGESSRPGAQPVTVEEELARVVPLVEALQGCGVPLSVDTVKPAVMAAALAAGADIINDISALSAEGALEVVSNSHAGVCLMHMQGQPATMQQKPQYTSVVAEVTDYLAGRIAAAEAAGIDRSRLMVDPGFGFGKQLAHNVALFRQLPHLGRVLNVPLLVGVSRKSMLGQLTGQPVEQRQAASIAAAMLAVQKGARVIRVHDVAATRDALTVLSALGGEAE